MPIRSYITVIALFMCCLSATAQTQPPTERTNISVKKAPHPYSQTILLGVAGPACGISLNYDIRFNGTDKGLGARIGFGYVPEYSEERQSWSTHITYKRIYKAKTTLPFGFNYVLAPSPRHMIEFGAGLTYMSGDSLWYDDISTSYTWLGWMSMHYRRTIGKHLLMRVGLVAMASKEYVAPFPTPEWGMGFRF